MKKYLMMLMAAATMTATTVYAADGGGTAPIDTSVATTGTPTASAALTAVSTGPCSAQFSSMQKGCPISNEANEGAATQCNSVSTAFASCATTSKLSFSSCQGKYLVVQSTCTSDNKNNDASTQCSNAAAAFLGCLNQ